MGEPFQKGNGNTKIEIKHVKGHYVVLVDGKFYCSAVTRHEAEKEKENIK